MNERVSELTGACTAISASLCEQKGQQCYCATVVFPAQAVVLGSNRNGTEKIKSTLNPVRKKKKNLKRVVQYFIPCF